MKKITELNIGKTLLIGVLISTSIVLLGGLLYLIQHGASLYVNPRFDFSLYHFTFQGVLKGLQYLNADSIILLGIAALVIVQLTRVALTIWLFISYQDTFFVWVSIIVFLMLIFSILGIG